MVNSQNLLTSSRKKTPLHNSSKKINSFQIGKILASQNSVIKVQKATEENEGRAIDVHTEQIRKGSGSKKGLNDRSIQINNDDDLIYMTIG